MAQCDPTAQVPFTRHLPEASGKSYSLIIRPGHPGLGFGRPVQPIAALSGHARTLAA